MLGDPGYQSLVGMQGHGTEIQSAVHPAVAVLGAELNAVDVWSGSAAGYQRERRESQTQR